MAALDEMNVGRLAPEQQESTVKRIINELFWNWFFLNQHRKVTAVKIWFFKKSVYVRDLKSIFELLVGPNPRF